MRLFIFIGSLLVIALVAALVGPRYVDWNQFKTRFETQASRVLGQKVSVLGQTSATLLPAPSVTFTDVRVGATEGGEPLIAAKSFRMNVELAALLKGDVVVTDMVLDQPKFEVSLDDKGQIAWPQSDVLKAQTVTVGGREIALPQIDLNEVALENITMTGGSVRLRDNRFDREETLSDINGTASATTLAGPWRANASFQNGSEKMRLRASTGRLQEDGRISARVTLQPLNSPYDIDFDGPVSFKDGQPSFDGKLRLRPLAQQSDDDLIQFKRPDRSTALPIRLEADLRMASGGASVAAFKLDIGSVEDPYIVTGNAQALFGETASVRIRAEGQQINVARLEGAVKANGQALDKQNAGLLSRLEALRAVLVQVPQFDIDSEVSLFLPAVVAGDTVIREVGVDLSHARNVAGGWQLSNLEAQLPGRTELRANGVLTVGERLGYEGELVLASRQPSGLAAWLGAGADAAVRDLKNVGFSADTKISDGQADFQNLEIILDGQSLKGALQRSASSNGSTRHKLTAQLEGALVNYEQLNAVFALFTGNSSATAFGTHDIDLELQAERLRAFGALATNVKTRFSLQGDALSLRQLDVGDLRGAALSIQGALTGLPNKAQGRLTGTLSAANAVDFLNFSQNRLPQNALDAAGAFSQFVEDPALLADTNLQLTLDADGTAYNLTAKGEVAKSDVDFSLRGEGVAKPLTAQNVKGRLVVVNDKAAIVLAQLGLPVVPVDTLERGALRINLEGIPKTGLKLDGAFTVREGYISASGVVASENADGQPGLSGALNIVSETRDMDPFILLSGLPIPGFGEGKSARLSGQVKLNGAAYALEGMKAQIGDVEVRGRLALNSASEPRPILSGTLKTSRLDGETVLSIVHAGGGDAENGQKQRPLLSGLDATIEFEADAVSLPAGQIELNKTVSHIIVRDGDITFDDVKARWGEGEVRGTIALAQSNVSHLANGRLTIKGGSLPELAALAGFQPAIAGNYDLNFAFETAGVDRGAMLNQLTGSGTLVPKNVMIRGLGADGFAQLLKSADGTDDEKLNDRAADLVKENLFDGRVVLTGESVDFNIASGVVRANTVSLSGEALSIKGNGRLDIAASKALVESTISFDAGRERVLGATPEVALRYAGKPNEINRTVDVSLMSTYLGMRVSERREREFEAQQSAILERQRLQRRAQIYRLEAQARQIAAQEAERLKELRRAQEEERKREEARRKREDIARKKIEAEIKQAEEQAKREALLEAGRRADREQRIEELRKRAEEAVKRFRNPLDEAVPAN